MRPEFIHSISKLHMIDAGIAFRCVQVKYAQDVASQRSVRVFWACVKRYNMKMIKNCQVREQLKS